MNKMIIEENNINLTNQEVSLNIKCPKCILNINGSVKVNEFIDNDTDKLDLTINLLENANLIYNRFTSVLNNDNTISINQEKNSSINFNYSTLIKDTSNITINTFVTGNNNITNINLKAVSNGNNPVIINATADCQKNTQNNNLIESIRVLNLSNNNNIIIPNLLVASNEIEVNHATTISNISDEDLFYLNSKGISKDKSINLIEKGFLISNLDINNEEKEQLKSIIGGE